AAAARRSVVPRWAVLGNHFYTTGSVTRIVSESPSSFRATRISSIFDFGTPPAGATSTVTVTFMPPPFANRDSTLALKFVHLRAGSTPIHRNPASAPVVAAGPTAGLPWASVVGSDGAGAIWPDSPPSAAALVVVAAGAAVSTACRAPSAAAGALRSESTVGRARRDCC